MAFLTEESASIANGGINFDNVIDKLTGLAITNHSHNLLHNQNAMIASKLDEKRLDRDSYIGQVVNLVNINLRQIFNYRSFYRK